MSAAPAPSETKKAHWWETPRRRGFWLSAFAAASAAAWACPRAAVKLLPAASRAAPSRSPASARAASNRSPASARALPRRSPAASAASRAIPIGSGPDRASSPVIAMFANHSPGGQGSCQWAVTGAWAPSPAAIVPGARSRVVWRALDAAVTGEPRAEFPEGRWAGLHAEYAERIGVSPEPGRRALRERPEVDAG